MPPKKSKVTKNPVRHGDESKAVENLRAVLVARDKKRSGNNAPFRQWATRLETARETATATADLRLTKLLLDAVDEQLGTEATARDCSKLLAALKATPEKSLWLVNLDETRSGPESKKAASLHLWKLLPQRRGEPMARDNAVKKSAQTQRRDRTGYVQKNRLTKVGVQAFVDPEVHALFKQMAATAGVPVNELMRHLIETTVAQGTDPAVKKAIAAEKDRADTARANILATLSPRTLTPSEN